MTKNEINKTLEKHAMELSAKMSKANLTAVDYAQCLDVLCHALGSIRPDPADPSWTPLFANSEKSH